MKKNSAILGVSVLTLLALGALVAAWPGPVLASRSGSALERREIRVEGWDSPAAVTETEELLTSVPGVMFARGRLVEGRVVLQLAADVRDEQLVDAVQSAGFTAVETRRSE